MQLQKVNSPLHCLVYLASSVQEFLDCLPPSASHWRDAKLGDLAYRGQVSSNLALVPRAFRVGEVIGYSHDAPTGPPIRVVNQARAEYDAVRQFVKTADQSGLHVSDTAGQILLYDDPQIIFEDPDWEHNWPQSKIIETLAIAQHHGVPTRLLDFTENPLVAAYFAASPGWDIKNQRIHPNIGNYLAVWVIDMRFIRSVNSIHRRYPERIGEVRVPRANNSYLHAQSGFFLIDRGANDVMNRRELLSIDKAISDRARFWHTGDRLDGNELIPVWFDQLPVCQIRLPISFTHELLIELDNRGVTKASVMPSLDRVVESLEFQRSIRT